MLLGIPLKTWMVRFGRAPDITGMSSLYFDFFLRMSAAFYWFFGVATAPGSGHPAFSFSTPASPSLHDSLLLLVLVVAESGLDAALLIFLQYLRYANCGDRRDYWIHNSETKVSFNFGLSMCMGVLGIVFFEFT